MVFTNLCLLFYQPSFMQSDISFAQYLFVPPELTSTNVYLYIHTMFNTILTHMLAKHNYAIKEH